MIPVILPLISVALPIFVLVRLDKRPVKNAFLYSVLSFACTFGALCMEVFGIRSRALSGDFGGIEDTVSAVLLICIGLSIIAVVLNLVSLAAYYGERSETAAEAV
ncbi:MAG: hypothetical protein IJP23_07190 [Oscillospiraceae bacterium]|nr:hypothetical protein [Oscillospiraceae bacterium]